MLVYPRGVDNGREDGHCLFQLVETPLMLVTNTIFLLSVFVSATLLLLLIEDDQNRGRAQYVQLVDFPRRLSRYRLAEIKGVPFFVVAVGKICLFLVFLEKGSYV